MKPRPHRYPLIHGIRVDVHALRCLAHRCEPAHCRYATSCCKTYEVLVDEPEMHRITGALPDAARYATDLREGDEWAETFEETDDGHCLATHEDGLCVFAFKNEDGHLLCSLHAAALDNGLHPYRVKPLACAIWPLFYQESEPPLLTVQDGATRFPCNTLRRSVRPALDAGVADIIRGVWGEPFLAAVEAAL